MNINTEKGSEKHEYFYIINEVQHGPVDIIELISKIDKNTLVWRDGIEWAKASEVAELQKFFPEPSVIMVNNPAPTVITNPLNPTMGAYSQTPNFSSPSRSLLDYPSLYRSTDNKVVFGVCGGLAHKLNIGTGLVRFICFCTLGFCYVYFLGIFLPSHPTKFYSR